MRNITRDIESHRLAPAIASMQSNPYEREVLANGAIRLHSGDGSFAFQRPRAGVLLVTISGHDKGQFGPGALDEISGWLTRERPLELFIDARAVVSIAFSVQSEWARFFSSNRSSLTAVHVLAESKVVRLTIAIASHFSRTGSLIRLHERAATFDRRLQQQDH